jgi:hypothetical protein
LCLSGEKQTAKSNEYTCNFFHDLDLKFCTAKLTDSYYLNLIARYTFDCLLLSVCY